MVSKGSLDASGSAGETHQIKAQPWADTARGAEGETAVLSRHNVGRKSPHLPYQSAFVRGRIQV